MKHSYSSSFDWSICPYRYFHKWIARDVPFESTEATEHGSRVHKALEERLASGKLLPEDLQQYEKYAVALDNKKPHVELRLGIRVDASACGFYDEDCYWNCKVDVAIVEPPTALIFDWKTSKTEREDPWELKVQALLLSRRFPELQNLQGRYVWLKHDKVGVPHELSDLQRTWAEMASIDIMIQRHKGLNHWPKREGPLCRWCPVLDCENNRSDAAIAAK